MIEEEGQTFYQENFDIRVLFLTLFLQLFIALLERESEFFFLVAHI